MRTLYWLFLNNPFLVKAIRARQRGGAIYWRSGLASLVALAGLVLVFDLARRMDAWDELPSYLQTYDLVVFCAMFAIGALASCNILGSSMSQEIITGTLEFQRLTTLTLRQIVAGKLVGELASVYLFYLSVTPMLVLSSLFGGYPLGVKLFGLFQCLTTALLFGAAGANVPAKTVARTNKPMNPFLGLIIGFIWFLVPAAITQGCNGIVGLVFGMFTPIPYILALYYGDFFVGRTVQLFGRSISIDLISPLFHLFFATLLVLIAARNLRQDERPPLARFPAYLLSIVILVIVLGVARSYPPLPYIREAYFFAPSVVLTVACLLLFHLCTPRKDGLIRWLWRERERATPLSYLFGDFSPPWATVLIFSLIYGSGLYLITQSFVAPAYHAPRIAYPEEHVWAYTFTLIPGFVLACLFIHGCNRAMGYGIVLLGAIEILGLFIAGTIDYLRTGMLEAIAFWGPAAGLSWISMIGWFVDNRGGDPGPVMGVFLTSHALYATGACIFGFGVLRYHARQIRQKKQEMGVLPPEPTRTGNEAAPATA